MTVLSHACNRMIAIRPLFFRTIASNPGEQPYLDPRASVTVEHRIRDSTGVFLGKLIPEYNGQGWRHAHASDAVYDTAPIFPRYRTTLVMLHRGQYNVLHCPSHALVVWAAS